jgi:hypothetical protein
MAQQQRLILLSIELQRPKQPVGASRIACQVEGKATAPAGAVPQVLLDLFWEMAEDEIELLDPLAGEGLDDVLDERPVHERQGRGRVTLAQRGDPRRVAGGDKDGAHVDLP